MLDKFAEQLLLEKGLTDLDPEVHSALVADISARANELINRRVVDALNEDQQKSLIQMVESGQDQSMIQKFIQQNLPNDREVTAKALIEFKALFLRIEP
jgi:hypothetical protein